MNFRIVFMGTPGFSVPSLEALVGAGCDVAAVVTQPDRPTGRHQVLTPPPVKSVAESYAIPVLQPDKVRTPEFERVLRDLAPDFLVTAAYGRILPAGVLAVPRLAPLNVHASLLPKYRGASPIQRCLIDGVTETGVTVMRMDIGMDTGDVILQRSLPVPGDMDAEELSEVLARLGAAALVEALDRFRKGTATYMRQDETQATTVRPLDREDGRIDWSVAARAVHDLVRGTRPWPGAYTTLCGARVKIHRSRLSTDDGRRGEPGAFLGLAADGVEIACGRGSVTVLELQPDSGRRMPARDFGHNLTSATRFGN